MRILKTLLVVVGLVIASAVFADPMPGISGKIQTISLQFEQNITDMAMNLLFSLFAVSFAVKSIHMVIKRAEIGELLANMVKTMLAIGAYVFFIKNAPWLLQAIIESARTLASTGSGLSASMLNPADIMSIGIDLQDNMVLAFNQKTGADSFIGALTNFFPSLLLTVACLMILFAFAMIAGNLFLAFAESYLILAVSPLMFALGATEWTKSNALKPFQSMISVAIKIMVVALVAAFTINMAPSWATQLASWDMTNWKPMWQTCFEILGIGVLAVWAPSKLSSAILSGGAGLSAGDGMQTAGNIGSIATGAGAAALAAGTGGASMLGQGAKSLAAATSTTPESAGRAVGSAMSSMAGGAGNGGVQPPGSGMSATPSANMPGGEKTGPIAASFGDSATPTAPSSSLINTDTNVGNAKAAASTPAAPVSANTSTAGTDTAGATSPATASTTTGDATGGSVGGAGNSASAPATKSDMQQAISQMMGGNKPSAMDHLSSIPNFVPPEGMVSGASVEHANHDS